MASLCVIKEGNTHWRSQIKTISLLSSLPRCLKLIPFRLLISLHHPNWTWPGHAWPDLHVAKSNGHISVFILLTVYHFTDVTEQNSMCQFHFKTGARKVNKRDNKFLPLWSLHYIRIIWKSWLYCLLKFFLFFRSPGIWLCFSYLSSCQFHLLLKTHVLNF